MMVNLWSLTILNSIIDILVSPVSVLKALKQTHVTSYEKKDYWGFKKKFFGILAWIDSLVCWDFLAMISRWWLTNGLTFLNSAINILVSPVSILLKALKQTHVTSYEKKDYWEFKKKFFGILAWIHSLVC